MGGSFIRVPRVAVIKSSQKAVSGFWGGRGNNFNNIFVSQTVILKEGHNLKDSKPNYQSISGFEKI